MYKKKCLFKNSNATWGNDPTAQESVYAYLYGAGETKQTGRYRIRITKMSAADLVAMGMAPEGTPPDFFGMQASLDKWEQTIGWLPLFDWVGDPDASLVKIEKDLNKQFKSFVTGLSLEDDFSFNLPKPPPPEKNTFKIPKKKEPDQESTPVADSKKEDPPDFEWI